MADWNGLLENRSWSKELIVRLDCIKIFGKPLGPSTHFPTSLLPALLHKGWLLSSLAPYYFRIQSWSSVLWAVYKMVWVSPIQKHVNAAMRLMSHFCDRHSHLDSFQRWIIFFPPNVLLPCLFGQHKLVCGYNAQGFYYSWYFSRNSKTSKVELSCQNDRGMGRKKLMGWHTCSVCVEKIRFCERKLVTYHSRSD